LGLRLTRIGQVRDLSDWPTVVEAKKTPLHPLTTQIFLIYDYLIALLGSEGEMPREQVTWQNPKTGLGE
jgi:hypothetical protein